MIRGSDGLDYENLTEKLLSNPAKTYRNTSVLTQRANGTSKADQAVWCEVYAREFDRLVVRYPQKDGYSRLADCADAEACCEADRALLFLRRERNRRVAKPLFAAQDRRSPG